MTPVARQFEGKVAETVIFDKGTRVASLAGTVWRQDAKDEIFRTIALGGGMMACRPLRQNVCVRV